MNDDEAVGSVIQDILDDTMTRAQGLDYAVYAVTYNPPPGGAATEIHGSPKLIVLNRSRNEQLTRRLQRFAFRTRTADRQVELWEITLHKVNDALRTLDSEFIKTGQGENVRVVLDVDMGGFFYTRLGRHAVLFGVTLDQAEVNSGRCEREMYQMVAQIEAVSTAYGA